MWVEDFTTTWRTEDPAEPAAASRLSVPMTLISWRARLDTLTELVSRKVCTMVSTWVARTIRLRIEYFWSERTNSVRSSGTRGSLAPRPRIISISASASRAWAMRPPQKVSSPVISTRRPMAQPNQMLRRSRSMSWIESCSRARMLSASSITRLLEYRSRPGSTSNEMGSSTRNLNLTGK